MRGLLALLLLTFSIAGCAMAPPSPLGADQIKSLRLTDISVSMAPNAIVSWANAEQEFVTAHKAANPTAHKPVVETASIPDTASADTSEYGAIAASPEGKAYVRDKAAGRIKQALEAGVKPHLQSGARPVTLEVSVREFMIPSAVQRAVLGGNPGIMATAVLKDAATGETLATRKDQLVLAQAGNGLIGVMVDQAFADLDVRLVNKYAEEYRQWLFREEA